MTAVIGCNNKSQDIFDGSDSVNAIIESAKYCLPILQEFSDVQLDAVISTISKKILEEAPYFAREEVLQTNMGCAQSKLEKLEFVCGGVTQNLLGVITKGRLDNPACAGLTGSVYEYADALGVIFAVVPLTNPIPNSLFKILNCIKTRNALVISFPDRVKHLGDVMVSMIQDILHDFSLPKLIVQTTGSIGSRQLIQQYMSHPDVSLILATGSSGLVKAAHSSGNPCYGVGPGNVPAFISKTANLNLAAQQIVASKRFDNGIICGSENSIIVDNDIVEQFYIQLIGSGAAVLDEREQERAVDLWFDPNTSKLRKELIGQSADYIADVAGIKRAYSIAVLVLPIKKNQIPLYGREKLAPIITSLIADGNAFDLCKSVLAVDGAGHTSVIHSNDQAEINRFALSMPTGRILVNTPATFGMMGVTTNIPLSFMVGSGSYGKNITTDNLGWKHLLNIKRLAYDKNAAE